MPIKTCEDCGCRVYYLGCVNCNEEAYIAAQVAEDIDSQSIGEIHVMPIDDMVEHIESPSCPCGPSEDTQEPRVMIHHSADRREDVERQVPS